MAREKQDDKLSKTDVKPDKGISRDVDDLLHDAARSVPANEEALADEDEDITP